MVLAEALREKGPSEHLEHLPDRDRARGTSLRAAERELSIYPVACADAGEYTVVVSNDIGSVTTLAGILIVPDCP